MVVFLLKEKYMSYITSKYQIGHAISVKVCDGKESLKMDAIFLMSRKGCQMPICFADIPEPYQVEILENTFQVYILPIPSLMIFQPEDP